MTQLEDDLDLEILRSINADVTADPDALARVRARALVTPTSRSAWRPRWTKLAIVAVAALAVGVTAAAIVPKPSAFAPTPSASQQAPRTVAQFTSDAAQASLLRSPLKPGPGQYRKVTATYKVIAGVNVQKTGATSRADQVWFRQQSIRTMWIPADPNGTWVCRTESWMEPVDDVSAKYLADHPELRAHQLGAVERAKRGAFNSTAPVEGASDWGSPSKSFVDQLPHDPDALLASAKKWNLGHDVKNDPEGLLITLAGPLTAAWVDDPELRAALFTAISKVDGLEINRNASIDGHVGISLKGRGDAEHDSWFEVLFSADDYQILATQWHVLPVSGNERVDQVSYGSEIVGSAP